MSRLVKTYGTIARCIRLEMHHYPLRQPTMLQRPHVRWFHMTPRVLSQNPLVDEEEPETPPSNEKEEQDIFSEEYQKKQRLKYEKWLIRKTGEPPIDLLLDDEKIEVISPKINPDFVIDDPFNLPEEMEQAVREHVHWACYAEHEVPFERNIARHHRLDCRKSIKDSKKRKLRKRLVVTPFVLIGAYQRLVQRANLFPYGQEDEVGSALRSCSMSFRRLAHLSHRLMGMDQKWYEFPRFGLMNKDLDVLLMKEAMAMVLHPLVRPFLPEHSWYLQAMQEDQTNMAWKFTPGTERVEYMAKQGVPYETANHMFMFWDLGAEGHLTLQPIQINAIENIISPYCSNWWAVSLNKIKAQSILGYKKSGKWRITEDKYTTFPSLLIDLLLLKLDYSDTLKLNPVFRSLREGKLSDRKKKNEGIFHVKGIPQKLSDLDYAHVDSHRYGPTICFALKGPEKLGEKLGKAVSTELKSTLHFHKKLVGRTGYKEEKPGKPRNRQEREARNEAHKLFLEQALRVDIARAGTGKTRNSRRLKLQEQGRILEKHGLLHLKKGKVPSPKPIHDDGDEED